MPRSSSRSGPPPASGVAVTGVPAAVIVATPPHVTRHRVFSPDAELLATQWSEYAVAPLPWVKDTGKTATPGVEGGFWVTASPWTGYAKPLSPNAIDPMSRPVAAFEKIASDLAFELRLPVPPVTLFERLNAPAGEARFHSVSAPPFDQVHRWGEIMASTVVLQMARSCVVPAMSAMVAFDTWLECGDHANNHPGNLLVTTAAAPALTAHCAWIDYGYSLTHTWRTQGCKNRHAMPMYDPTLVADVASMKDVVDAIEAVSDDTIRRIVSRIPDAFLGQPDKAVIVDGLMYRRDNLRPIVAATHPGVL